MASTNELAEDEEEAAQSYEASFFPPLNLHWDVSFCVKVEELVADRVPGNSGCCLGFVAGGGGSMRRNSLQLEGEAGEI
ncbi:hypothetical protein SLEP1_g10229 [Rubroshorea leprosula]|uniref:Uncharacterized protein n=1 Tax=Rubroshorea leprosula TaxID=152421 RepID=A0AAV5IDB1_9ROSI|nr:hypothetical protein SLEP1_g10229 [Rubroshorea leprosula]